LLTKALVARCSACGKRVAQAVLEVLLDELNNQGQFEVLMNMRSSAIKVVKRKDREAAARLCTADVSSAERSSTLEIVQTVKSWMAETRLRRQTEAKLAIQFMRGFNVENSFEASKSAAKSCLITVVVAILIVLAAHEPTRAQSSTASTESLSLDQAIELALRNNHSIKIAEFGVSRAQEDIAVAKTSRLPALHMYTLVSGNLAKNDIKIPNPAANQFPGLGPFFLLTQERKPAAVFAVTAAQPLTQQYRIGLHIKLERVSREMAEAKLRQERNETIDQVKKTYYAILQTKSALSSVEQAVKSYQELNKVTGDYVVQQIALKADYLVVQTRLAQAQYEQLDLSSRLATQKEQLNSLLGREVSSDFEVIDASPFMSIDADLSAARKVALERRPELQRARLTVEQANLARRIKKSEYIPDVSAGFTYLTPRNFPSVVPREFANVGVIVSWEFFDWGRKKHQLAEIDYGIEQAKNGLKETEDKVLVEVGDKLRKLQLTGQALRVAKLTEEAAKENLRVSTGQYRFQAVMLSDVLKSQATLAETTNGYQRALLAFWTAKAEFEKALGEDK
jgi:outer membrane protein TolC